MGRCGPHGSLEDGESEGSKDGSGEWAKQGQKREKR